MSNWTVHLSPALLMALVLSGPVHAQNKDEGIQESDESKGLTKAEEAMLLGGASGASAQFVRKFKAGRADHQQDQKSRNARIFQMHDRNFNGVTDHATNQGPSTLEANTERAAFGKDRMTKEARKNATTEFQEKKRKECEEKYRDKVAKQIDSEMRARPTPAPGTEAAPPPDEANRLKAICYQPSQNIANVGSAHDGDLGEHRMYQVTEKARLESEAAGNAFAQESMAEMANYIYEDNPDIQRSSKKGKIMVRVLRNGKATMEERDQAPNIDLMYSEAASLEDKVRMNVMTGAKTFRAKKLAEMNFEDDHELEELVGTAYKSDNPKDIAAGDAAVANALSIRAQLIKSPAKYCADGIAKDSTCDNGETPLSFGERMKKLTTAAEQEKFRRSAMNSMSVDKKAAKERTIHLQRCMDISNKGWCDVSSKDATRKNNYKAIAEGTDPGAQFKDTREYLYQQTYVNMQGGLDGYEASMIKNGDFKNHPDRKAFQEAVRANQKAAKEFQDEERQREAASGGTYKSPYLNGGFNTRTMNSRQLFGRDLNRGDASFLGNTRGPNPQSGMRAPSGGNGGGAGAARPQPPMQRPPSAIPTRN